MRELPDNVLLDCRWLGFGGAGRATELLLKGLGEVRPPWVLWGQRPLEAFAWSGARVVQARGSSKDPSRWFGQAQRPPRAELAIFMHQIRPHTTTPSITLVHDTIPLRIASQPARTLKRAYFRWSARSSLGVLTVSDHSAVSIQTDLGVTADRVRIVRYPADADLAYAVGKRAPKDPPMALYVGRFAPHKNVRALVEAFALTAFSRSGGRLTLVGGSGDELRALKSLAAQTAPDKFEVVGHISDADLHELYRTSSLLVMPSLEEGFGLPVWEALACGIPICVSDRGSLPEVAGGVRCFDMTTPAAIATAIDTVWETPAAFVGAPPAVTTQQFGTEVIAAIREIWDAAERRRIER